MTKEAPGPFKYMRAYATYSSGMTDVGARLGPWDPEEKKYTTASQDERVHAAIERDAVLIAKAVGPDVTPQEFEDIYDQVEFLQAQLLGGKLTDASYQEKLWTLPEISTKNRQKPQDVHYKPDRDKAGRPTGKPGKTKPLVQKPPISGVGALEPLDRNEIWKNILDKVAADMGGGPLVSFPNGPPPAPGSKAQNVPLQPSPSVTPPQPSQAGRLNPQRYGNGLLDWLQTGLDAVGVVEPTPFADATNAGISVLRAFSEPHRAGEHLRNAGVSLISMIPYVGDLAKVQKYAGRSTNASSASAGGIKGSWINTLGSLLTSGGNAGKGGGGLPPGPTNHDESPASPSPGSNPIENSTDGFHKLLGVVGKFALITGPLVIGIGSAIVGVKMFVSWLEKVDSASRKLIEENRDLAKYDGGLNASYMMLQHQRVLREVHRAHELSGSLSRLTRAQSRFENSQHEFFMPFDKLKIELQAGFANTAALLLRFIDMMEPVSEQLLVFIEWWFGKDLQNTAKSSAETAAEQFTKRINDWGKKL